MYKFLGVGCVVAAMSCLCSVVLVEAAATSTTYMATTTVATTTMIQNQQVVEKRVREYFFDVPAMVQIARCESNFRQFTDSGSPFRGGVGGEMVGVFQFYEKYHAQAARVLGFDLATLEGNIGYARHLYEQSGTGPWASCAPTPALYDNTQLKIELMTKLIVLLQELLQMKLSSR